MSTTYEIRVADAVTPDLIEAFRRLVPQLSKSSPPPTEAQLAEMVAAEANDIVVAQEPDGRIVGCLTLITFRIPTGIRCWIEDVVVDEAARGRGVGEALNRFTIELAHSKGARTLDLTSRPSREAANRLYQRLGFVRRDSNVYRFDWGAAD
jgi:ribosomal protein S18 acetylase RimI-like enzyme